MWAITVVYEPLHSNSAEVYSAAGSYSYFIAECFCWALCKQWKFRKCSEMNLPLSSVRHLLLDHANKEKTRNTQSNTNIQTCTATRHTVSICNELWPTVPLGRFLLFFTLRSSSEHEFIWSNDQKIKSAKPSVCLGHSVSVSRIYGQERLKETAGHFD